MHPKTRNIKITSGFVDVSPNDVFITNIHLKEKKCYITLRAIPYFSETSFFYGFFYFSPTYKDIECSKSYEFPND